MLKRNFTILKSLGAIGILAITATSIMSCAKKPDTSKALADKCIADNQICSLSFRSNEPTDLMEIDLVVPVTSISDYEVEVCDSLECFPLEEISCTASQTCLLLNEPGQSAQVFPNLDVKTVRLTIPDGPMNPGDYFRARSTLPGGSWIKN